MEQRLHQQPTDGQVRFHLLEQGNPQLVLSQNPLVYQDLSDMPLCLGIGGRIHTLNMILRPPRAAEVRVCKGPGSRRSRSLSRQRLRAVAGKRLIETAGALLRQGYCTPIIFQRDPGLFDVFEADGEVVREVRILWIGRKGLEVCLLGFGPAPLLRMRVL